MHPERTLVLIKPDGVERGIVGKIITRFEDAGLKMVGLKLQLVDQEFAQKHYREDLAKRRGEKVRRQMVEMLSSGPVVAMVIEGIEAIETVRKIVGPTEPKSAPPGTIRGDFSHMSYAWADSRDVGVRNVIHASSSAEEAQIETALWFAETEIINYRTVHERHVHGQ